MTLAEAAQVIFGTKPASAAQLEAARAITFQAAQQGYKFSIDNQRGSPAEPCIVIAFPINAN